MAELNLALKKDVFENLLNGNSNEIPIKKNDWWKKRLMDPDTGKFKWFDLVMASSGSSDKYAFEIDHIEDQGEKYVIFVVLEKPMEEEVEQPEFKPTQDDIDRIQEMINQKALEELREQEEEDRDVDVDVDMPGEFVRVPEVTNITPKNITPQPVNQQTVDEYASIKGRVSRLITAISRMKDAYIVNMPLVTIRNNGQIIGCFKNFTINFDRDMRFAFAKKEFVLYPERGEDEFFNQIEDYMKELLKSNYLFINKNACVFSMTPNGLLTFTVTAVGKRKYLFNGR